MNRGKKYACAGRGRKNATLDRPLKNGSRFEKEF